MPPQAVGPFLIKRAHHHGLILRALGDTIAFCPPLIINEAEIDLMFERFALALDDTLGDGSGARTAGKRFSSGAREVS